MGSVDLSLDVDAQQPPRSKEENQERAFVAASRRKDRSIDARLESANRASMLHKKRTGKALYITKEIVEKEAMYEEVDERYQEKRLKLLRAHNSQLEAEFQRHLVAAMAYGANNSRQMARISPIGGIQKMRGDVSTVQSLFARRSQQPLTPISSANPSPTSPAFNSYDSSPSDSHVQTPGSCYVQTPQPYSYISQQMPAYLAQQMNWNSHSAASIPFYATQQPINSLETSQSQSFRQRVASVPDALLFQQQQQQQTMAPSVPDVSRAQSEPFHSVPVPDSNNSQIIPDLSNNALMTPELSPPPMTCTSSQNSFGNEACTQTAPVSFDMGKQAVLGVVEVSDPEYHDFLDYAATMENQWQMPVLDSSSCYDEWVPNVDFDYELQISNI